MSRPLTVRVALAVCALICGGTAVGLAVVSGLDNTLATAETSFDAGNRQPGAVVTHTYILTNRSLALAHITSVVPSCTCDTEAKAALTEVPWLGGTEVTVHWRTPAKAGAADTQVVITYTGEGGNGKVILTMNCVVVPRESPGSGG